MNISLLSLELRFQEELYFLTKNLEKNDRGFTPFSNVWHGMSQAAFKDHLEGTRSLWASEPHDTDLLSPEIFSLCWYFSTEQQRYCGFYIPTVDPFHVLKKQLLKA